MTPREQYLFANHSKEQIRRWCAELKQFRFCRAYGGHANDGDSFQTAIEFADEAELRRICELLGIPLNVLPPDHPKPVVGQPYTSEEFAQFKSEIRAFPHLEQPGWKEIRGVRVFVWAEPQYLLLSLSGADGDAYEVSERDFENAKILELTLENLDLRFVHPTRGCQCLCPEC